jgi:hypothetical protein
MVTLDFRYHYSGPTSRMQYVIDNDRTFPLSYVPDNTTYNTSQGEHTAILIKAMGDALKTNDTLHITHRALNVVGLTTA